MPFIEEASPFMLTPSSHELLYNRQNKKFALVPTGQGTNAAPGRTIEHYHVVGSAATLVRSIHHDLSSHYDSSSPEPARDREMLCAWIGDLTVLMDRWMGTETGLMAMGRMSRYATGSDPVVWLTAVLKPALGDVWKLFLSFLTMSGLPDESAEVVIQMFVTLHIQSLYRAYLIPTPGMHTPATLSIWTRISVILDSLQTYNSVPEDVYPAVQWHRQIVDQTIEAVRNLGHVDRFVCGVDPVVVWVALVDVVETDNEDNNNNNYDGEEVCALMDLFLAIAVFDVGRRPVEAEAMMDCYTRSVFHPEVKDAIRRWAGQFPTFIVAEPYRRRLESL